MAEEIVEAVTEGLRAVQETAKLGGKAIDAASGAARWLADAMGTVPQDLVGVLGGDKLRYYRIKNIMDLQEKTERVLRERGVKETKPVSPAVMVPILEAAAEESRDELQELMAKLLATAMDPHGAAVRREFIETVKQLDPEDALVVQELSVRQPPDHQVTVRSQDPNRTFNMSQDQLAISVRRLRQLGCLEGDPSAGSIDGHGNANIRSTPFGRELVRAIKGAKP